MKELFYHKKMYGVVVLLLSFVHQLGGQFACNGNATLCSRRYNDVAYAATHNGQSHIESPVCNQDLDVIRQLESGVRAMKIPVWYDRDEQGASTLHVCHGVTKDILGIKFLDQVEEKIPRLFRSFAHDVFKKLEPINEVMRDACLAAYGQDDGERGVI